MSISTCVSSAAFTAVAVGELNAVVGPDGVTGVGQTLVDVAFAALTYVACRAHTLVTSNAVHTPPVIEALGLSGQRVAGGVAIIQIDLTVDAYRRENSALQIYYCLHFCGQKSMNDFEVAMLVLYLVFLWDTSTCTC